MIDTCIVQGHSLEFWISFVESFIICGDGFKFRLAMEKLTRAMSIKMMSFMETDRGGPGGAEAFVDRLTLWWNLFVCGWSYICTHYFLERMLHALGTSNCFLYYLIWIHWLDLTWLRNAWLEETEGRPVPSTLVPYDGRVWLCQTTHEENRPVFQAAGNLAWT